MEDSLPMPRPDSPFTNLFVLELANNHWGDVERGKRIIREHAYLVRQYGIKAAIKLQFRDVPTFVHKDFRDRDDIRYVAKTTKTELSKDELYELVKEIWRVGCMAMATPFDETSVEWCREFDLDIIKLASSDVNDWSLIEAIARLGKPVIASSGGAREADLDNLVRYFKSRGQRIAVNHCVSLYPTENEDLQLNEIDYLRDRYPDHVIGLSTHEYKDWQASMFISYAKGARTWERHIDIEDGEHVVSPYCSLPINMHAWYDAYHLAREMCGQGGSERRRITDGEDEYLSKLVRGVYARRELSKGHVITHANFERDFYLAIPLQPRQASVRDIMDGLTLTTPIHADAPVLKASLIDEYADVKRHLEGKKKPVEATSQNHRGKPQ
jgi:sialic acid synthase SpsE